MELTREDVVGGDEPWQITRRMERLNELGFDVQELAMVRSADGERLRIRPTLVEEGHHSRALASRTGLAVQENQARRLLNDIAAYGAWLEQVEGVPVPEAAAAYRWLTEIYRPAIERVPARAALAARAARAVPRDAPPPRHPLARRPATRSATTPRWTRTSRRSCRACPRSGSCARTEGGPVG